MRAEKWDSDIYSVANDVRQIALMRRSGLGTVHQRIIADKLMIIRGQSHVSQSLELLSEIAGKESGGFSDRQKVLFHWCGFYADKLKAIYERQAKFLCKSMWLYLLKTRLAGQNEDGEVALGDHDLVEMGIRQQNLLKTEKQLSAQLMQAFQHKQSETRRHQELLAIAANKAASSSMQERMGRNFREARRNPVVSAVSGFLSAVTLPLRLKSEGWSLIESTCSEVDYKTRSIMSRCRDLVLEKNINQPDKLIGRRKELEQLVVEIDRLHNKVKQAEGSVMLARPPAGRLRVTR